MNWAGSLARRAQVGLAGGSMLLLAGCICPPCVNQTGATAAAVAPAPAPAPVPEAPPISTAVPAPHPVAVGAPPAPAQSSAAARRSTRAFELSYTLRPPQRNADRYWRVLERDVRALVRAPRAASRAAPPIPELVPLPQEPQLRKVVQVKARPRVVADRSVVIDRKRRILTIRGNADQQQKVADYLRARRAQKS